MKLFPREIKEKEEEEEAEKEHVKKVKLLCQGCAYRRFLTLWIGSRTFRKFIRRSKTAPAKVPRGGKHPRSESRYSAHKLTSAVTYMRCTVPLEEREISVDKAMMPPYLGKYMIALPDD